MTFSTIDIETRRRLGQECEELLLQLEYVLDSINDGLVILDLDGNVLAMNKMALALHEFDDNEQVRRHLSMYQEIFRFADLQGEPLPFEQWPFMRTYRGEQFQDLEVQVSRGEAGRVWVGSYSGAPVKNKAGEVILTVITVRDITVKKRTEEALALARENIREITKIMPVRVIRCGKDGRYLWVSDEYATWLGRLPEEIVGHAMMEIIGEEAYTKITPYIEQVLTGQRVTYETVVNYKGIGPRWITATYMPTNDAAGAVDGWFGVVFDITDRKDLEDELKRSNETLEERIQQAVEELRHKDELLLVKGRQAVIGETISNIAHQWRQPLNTLALLTQDLQLTFRAGGGSQEYLESNVMKSMNTIRHLSKTIDDFRFFIAPCEEAREFEAREVLERTISLLQASLAAQNISTEIAVSGNPILKGCPSDFSQVLLNILDNARDAFAAGEVTDPQVTISVYSDGGRTVVTVTDNAGGIPAPFIEKVFDPYFSTKGSNHGKGMGLFMCKTIVDKSMNGSISVRNVAGGAQFRIEI